MDTPDPRPQPTLNDHAPNDAATEKLRLSEIRYRRLFEAARDGVLLIDPVTYKIVDANPFMTKLLGYSHQQLAGKELFEIGRIADQRASQEKFLALLATGHIRYEDLPLKSMAGIEQEVEVVANVYEENGQPIVQCNIRDITERKRMETDNKLLMAEVNHRAKNLLAVVQAIASQTAKHSDPTLFVERLSERIGGLAACQDLLVANEWNGVDIAELIKAQLGHFVDLFGTRVQLSGPPLRLKAAAAQAIGMALHELATNAGKYGALSNAVGVVRIAWVRAAQAATFSMSWLEQGGPEVVAPSHRGFGQVVIERMVETAVDGSTETHFLPTGLSWTLTAPVGDVVEQGNLLDAKSQSKYRAHIDSGG